jgi:hypothetical protein
VSLQGLQVQSLYDSRWVSMTPGESPWLQVSLQYSRLSELPWLRGQTPWSETSLFQSKNILISQWPIRNDKNVPFNNRLKMY